MKLEKTFTLNIKTDLVVRKTLKEMSNIKEIFKTKINFVRPLYRHVERNKTIPSKLPLPTHNTKNLRSNGNDIQNERQTDKHNDIYQNNNTDIKKYQILLPGECTDSISAKFSTKYLAARHNDEKIVVNRSKMINTPIIEAVNGTPVKTPDTWLRVCPCRNLPDESICSIIFRNFMCQLGLSIFLIIWTAIWVYAIHLVEEPFEELISKEFQAEQNKLVIDLATELRQITPLSPKWRKKIEERIEKERQLTIAAVSRGARLHPGHFWDLAGTFLFCIYVMTALGFGAPVPQTVWGRTLSLLYAAIAIPGHIYLMVNLSKFVVIKGEKCYFKTKRVMTDIRQQSSNINIPNYSRESVLGKAKAKGNRFVRKIILILRPLFVGRFLPLAVVVYYLVGMIVFGIARGKQPLEVIMFPIEFTTTGGLEQVETHVRVIYGIYVEGAMFLLSCVLATLRRRSSQPIDRIAERYRLLTSNS